MTATSIPPPPPSTLRTLWTTIHSLMVFFVGIAAGAYAGNRHLRWYVALMVTFVVADIGLSVVQAWRYSRWLKRHNAWFAKAEVTGPES